MTQMQLPLYHNKETVLGNCEKATMYRVGFFVPCSAFEYTSRHKEWGPFDTRAEAKREFPNRRVYQKTYSRTVYLQRGEKVD